MLRNEWVRQIGAGVQAGLMIWWSTIGFAPQLFAATKTTDPEDVPPWWLDRGIINPDVDEVNLAVVRLGQLKWISLQAFTEIEALLGDISGAATALAGLKSDLDDVFSGEDFGTGLPPYDSGYNDWLRNNYSPANIGQVKAAAKPIYDFVNSLSPDWVSDQLNENLVNYEYATSSHATTHGYIEDGVYPWDPDTAVADNYAVANLAQLKAIFALRFRSDNEVNTDGLPDFFEYGLIAYDSQFSGKTLSQITGSLGDAFVSIDDGGGNLTRTSVAPPFQGLAAASASVSSLLAQHEPVGAVSGSFEVAGDGSATYAIPIDLPKGTAGMVPKLAVAYSSNGGNGILGLGFDLTGLQRITRGPATFYKDGFADGVDFDGNDRFFLDGERLISVSGTYGANGAKYRTESDSFARITSHGSSGSGPASWTVETKSGLAIEFGGTPDSCICAPDLGSGSAGVLVWGVNAVEDTVGNYYEVEYYQDNQDGAQNVSVDYRPKTVSYTGNDGQSLAPYNEVRFVYEGRDDKTTGFLAGVRLHSEVRLTDIEVYYVGSGEQLLYSYEFNYIDEVDYADDWADYIEESQTPRSRLRSVVKRPGDGSAPLPATVFEWGPQFPTPDYEPWMNSDYSLNGARAQNFPSWTYNQSTGYQFLDINSDGLPDRVNATNEGGTNHGIWVGLNDGLSIADPGDWDELGEISGGGNTLFNYPIWSDGAGNIYATFLDMNGDGWLDRVYDQNPHNSLYRIWVSLFDGEGYSDPEDWEEWGSYTGSVNGQTRPVFADGNGNVKGAFIDVNGDGLPDKVDSKNHDTGESGIWVRLNTGSEPLGTMTKWADVPSPQYAYPTYGDSSGNVFGMFIDVNGDGLPDRVYHLNPNTSEYGIWVSLNDGAGFAGVGDWEKWGEVIGGETGQVYPVWAQTSTTAGQKSAFVDVNGDGLPDRVDHKNYGTSEAGLWVRLNSGSGEQGFLPPVKWADVAHPDRGYPLVTDDEADRATFQDVNGDGLPDRVFNHKVGGSPDYGLWVRINNGLGFEPIEEWLDWSTTSEPTRPVWRENAGNPAGSEFSKFVDVNGDGLPDRVDHYDYDGSEHGLFVRINRGNSFESQDTPEQERVISITDGLGAEILVEYQRLNEPTTDERTEQWGGPAAWKYDTYTRGADDEDELALDIIRLSGGRYVVSRYAEQDGVGGYRWKRHHYAGLKYDRKNEVSLGFESIIVVDEAREQCNITTYRQTRMDETELVSAYPEQGMPLESDSLCWDPVLNAECRISFSQNFYDNWATAVNMSGYANDDPPGTISTSQQYVYHPYQSKAISYRYDSNELPISITITDQVFPSGEYGFATSVTTVTAPWGSAPLAYSTAEDQTAAALYGSASIDALEVETTNTYEHTTEGDWHLGRLTDSEVTKSLKDAEENETSLTKNSEFDYNDDGLLTLEIVQSDDKWEDPEQPLGPSEVITIKSYDDFGNVTGTSVTAQVDGIGGVSEENGPLQERTSQVDYDQKGRFMDWEENQLGHRTTYSYDEARALLLSTTDPDGRTTQFFYDSWGTQVLTRHPDGTETAEVTCWAKYWNPDTQQWTANPNCSLPSGISDSSCPVLAFRSDPDAEIVFIRRSQSSGSPPASVYIDKQGRELVAEAVTLKSFSGSASNHASVYTRTDYDARGRKVAESLPFFAGDSILATQITYDHLDRITLTTHPDGTTDSAEYSFEGNRLVTKLTNRKGYNRIRTENALGQTVSNCDCGLGTSGGIAVTYLYDAEGRVVQTNAPGSHTVTTTYDLLGNVTSVNDSDTGSSYSVYNGFGELIETGYGSQTKTAEYTYDVLGRETTRTTYVNAPTKESVTTTTYDPDNATGAVHTVKYMKGGTVENSYDEITYDHLGRPVSTLSRVLGEQYVTSTTYDELGRVRTETDAAGLTVLHEYDSAGFQIRLRNYSTGTVYSEPREFDASGRSTEEYLGNGVVTNREYHAPTGLLTSIESDVGGGTDIQDLSYGWDSLGNLRYRASGAVDGTSARYEHFKYDQHNRLLNHEVNTGSHSYGGSNNLDSDPSISANTHEYDEDGDLKNKPGIDTNSISYSGHRVTAATQNGTAHSYTYDSQGRLTLEQRGGNDFREIAWTSFGQIASIKMDDAPRILDIGGTEIFATGDSDTSFKFGASLQRIWSQRIYNASGGDTETITTTYLGNVELVVTVMEPSVGAATTTETTKHYIGGLAIYEETSVNGGATSYDLKYLLKDHLGSLETCTDEQGNILERLSYNAWGQLRDGDTWGSDPGFNEVRSPDCSTRGFTGHEMLDESGLVHMNGRIYNPVLGCFLSPDPFVQAPENPHNYNRYAYVLHNPLSATDPSGYFIGKLFEAAFSAISSAVQAIGSAVQSVGKWVSQNWRTLANIAIAVLIYSLPIPVDPITKGAIAGSITGATGSALAGGDAGDILRGAAIGGITGAATGSLHYVGDWANGLQVAGRNQAGTIFYAEKALTSSQKILRSTLWVGGHGVVGGTRNALVGGKFEDGFLSAAAGALSGFIPLPEQITGTVAGGTAVAAIAGGTVEAIGGGKFANGAYTGAFQHLFNHAASTTASFLALAQIRNEVELRWTIWNAAGQHRMNWMRRVLSEFGQAAIPGAENNPRIVEYHGTSADLRQALRTDETNWCSSFCNWILANHAPTGSGVARRWENWGTDIGAPAFGAVGVLHTNGINNWQGHVGFVIGVRGNQVLMLGGNQGRRVQFTYYPRDRFTAFRMPSDYHGPLFSLPVQGAFREWP